MAPHRTPPSRLAPAGKCQLSRRGFMKSMGISAAAASVAGLASQAQAQDAPAVPVEGMVPVTLLVNGRERRLLVEPRWTLLFVLREKLGVASPKPGCERGECGACTVLLDNLPRYACLTLAVEAEGKRIETVENLGKGESLGPVQQAFLEEDAYQCGYCTPGQIMAAEGLLRAKPDPGPEEIRLGMSGNLCRCGAYGHIANAVAKAAVKKQS